MTNFNYHGPLVVFDLDDTLFRERDFCRSGFRHILARVENEVGEIPGTVFDDMNRALTSRQNPFDVFESEIKPLYISQGLDWNLDAFIADYRMHIPDINLAGGMLDILRNLQKRRVIMGIVTDGRSNSQRGKISALGLDEFIDRSNILISEETGFDKTSSEPFSFFVRKYPEANKFFYIADNPSKDFLQPNLLGWETVCVPTHPDNVHPCVYPEDDIYHPSHHIESLSEIIPIIFG